MIAGQRLWTTQEDLNILALSRLRVPVKDIAIRCGRMDSAVTNRLRKLRMTPAKKEAERERTKIRNRKYRSLRASNRPIPPRLAPAPSALIDRDHRFTLVPRDLTAAFFSDPLPGYSALDKRSV